MNTKRVDVSLNKEEVEALRIVLEYVFDSERDHFMECEPSERKNHVLAHCLVVMDALGMPGRKDIDEEISDEGVEE